MLFSSRSTSTSSTDWIKCEEFYDMWKVVELEFRQDHCSCNLKFAAGDYDRVLGLAEESHKLHKEMQDLFGASWAVSPRSSLNGHGGDIGIGYSNKNG